MKEAPFCHRVRSSSIGEGKPVLESRSVRVARHADYAKVNGCAVEAALDVIGGKWKGVVLYQLISGPKGFNELRKKFPELSQRTLSRQLQELEKQRVIDREVLPGKPARTRYSLADLGLELAPILGALKNWGDRVLVTAEKNPTRRLRHRAK